MTKRYCQIHLELRVLHNVTKYFGEGDSNLIIQLLKHPRRERGEGFGIKFYGDGKIGYTK